MHLLYAALSCTEKQLIKQNKQKTRATLLIIYAREYKQIFKKYSLATYYKAAL